MRTPTQVSQDIRAKLGITLPALSLEVGTPERKIVDAVAEAISESYMDQYAHGAALDIDTKIGLELEQFVGLFGFGRLQGRRATGVVRVEMSSVAAQDVMIQKGMQFYAPNGGGTSGEQLYFHATENVILSAGLYAVDVPVECVLVGSVGNVPAGSVEAMAAGFGAMSATNLAPMSGGVNVETDDELRHRFRTTFMRNIAGTEDFYMSLALNHQAVSRVAVYGPVSLYRTQIAAPSSSSVLSVNQDVKYVWNESESVFTNLGQKDEEFFSPLVDYTFTGGTTATFSRTSSSAISAGEVIDIEFEYTTRASRNDPTQGLTNKVDVYVNGSDPFLVSEKTVVSGQNFVSQASSPFFTDNFVRLKTNNEKPSTTNRFMRLGSTPFVAFPPTIVVKTAGSSVTTTYQEGVHYYVVRSTTLLAGTEREIAGIEWLAAGPPTGTEITISYVYNRVPELLNALVRTSKQITTDVLYHEAQYRYLKLHLDIEYDRGTSIQQTNHNIDVRLREFFSMFAFGQWIEMSDVIHTVHGVTGVDDVVVTPQGETADYGIKVYSHPEAEVPLSTQSQNFKLDDNQLPILLGVVINRKPNR